MSRISLILLFSIATSTLFAQDPASANRPSHIYEVWTGFTVKKKLSDKFSVDLENQYRFNTDLGGLRQSFLELGVNYKAWKALEINAQYRFAFRQFVRNTNRFALNVSYKWKVKPVKMEIKFRSRFQNTIVTYTGQSISFFRNKLTLTYKINKKWNVYGAYEAFANMNDEYEHQANRFSLGVHHELNKKFKLKTYLQLDQDLHGKYRPTRSVLGVMLSYKFK